MRGRPPRTFVLTRKAPCRASRGLCVPRKDIQLSTHSTTITEYWQAFDQWRDCRLIPRDDLRDVSTFFMYTDTYFSEYGMLFRGLSLRQYQEGWRLAVKVTERGIPLVGFCTGPTTTRSVCKFLNLMEDGNVKWQTDRYP